MSSYFRSYFQFTAREKKGLTVLALLFAVVVVLKYVVHSTPYEPDIKIETLELQRNELILKTQSGEKPVKSWFHFNPNTISSDSMKLLPIPIFLSQRMKKIVVKGKIFRTKMEVAKVYGMPSELFAEMRPWLLLPDSNFISKREFENKKTPPITKHIIKVDLNSADSAELEHLPGIGPYLASVMVKYRKKLGGYLSYEQLNELKGMRPETLESIRGYILINEENVQFLNPNQFDVSTAGRHPYIGFEKAKRIVQYRNMHGKYSKSEDLLKIHGMDTLWLQKVEPYLRFD